MSNLIKVLSIDGGGVRGLIPAIVLAEIESRTGKRTAELFDLIAGTSTGGILSLGLTKPDEKGKPYYAARDLITLYKEESKIIFPLTIFSKLKALFNTKYPSKPLEHILQKYFGETRLSEALTEVLVASYELKQRDPFFFRRYNALEKPSRNFKMVEVARAACAAPTYFEPLHLKKSDRTYLFIDGGVFANNPAMFAYTEAKTRYKDATKFLVVSIGTGQLTNQLEYKQVKKWGQLGWVQPIFNVFFDGISDAVDYQMNSLLSVENQTTYYYRFQIDLQELRQDISDHMDDASDENIAYLEDLAQRIISKEDQRLETLCQLLVASR